MSVAYRLSGSGPRDKPVYVDPITMERLKSDAPGNVGAEVRATVFRRGRAI